jgi:hypothetical protein
MVKSGGISGGGNRLEPDDIKQQLNDYLQKRSELNADELAKK